MTRDDVEMLVENLQGVFEDKDGLRIMLEHLVHEAMGAEVTNHLNARRHARSASRRGYRNGTKPRKLKTRVGELDLAVPQTRNCEPYHPSLYAKWQRSERALLTACAEMYLQGVSTRRVQNVLQEMCGLELSAMSVSRIAAELDEKLTTFRNRPLVGQTYRYVMVDARYENIRVDGQVVSQAVMIVCGFNDEGGREILDWRIGDSESEATWGALFADMKKRGLSGVALVISDAHEGIVSALRRHFQGGRWQRCKVHFMREAAKKVAYKVRGELLSDLRLIFKGGDLASCLRV